MCCRLSRKKNVTLPLMITRTLIYTTTDEADANMFYRCFFCLLLFSVFPSATKIPDNCSRDG